MVSRPWSNNQYSIALNKAVIHMLGRLLSEWEIMQGLFTDQSKYKYNHKLK